jgi:MFS family permease
MRVHADADIDSEKEPSQLDDVDDRKELRGRYDMLLQEVRVVLPGVQVLSAFLLTAPFSQRFAELDTWGRRAFGVALASSMLSVILLLGPTLLHHLGERTARSARLSVSIVLLLLGIASLAVALMSALWGVSRFVFGTATAWAVTLPVVATVVLVWLVLPRLLRPNNVPAR